MYLDALGKEIDFLHYDLQRQQIPQLYMEWFWVHPSDQKKTLTWTLPLNKGYGFLLRRLGGQYTLEDMVPPLVDALPPIAYIQLFDTTRGRTWQNTPYPQRLVLTQGDVGYNTAQLAPVDAEFNGMGQQVKPVKNKITYNNYYAYRQTIKIEITFALVPVLVGNMFLVLILDGYLIPELGLEQWQ